MVDFEALLSLAVEKKASDLVLTAQVPPMLRLRGEMHPVGKEPLAPEAVKKLVYEILRQDQVVRFEQLKDLDFSFTFHGKLRFRGNVFQQRGAVGAVFRLVPTEIPALETLGLPPVLRELALRPQGLVLVTGPTGHGKSTTQAAMIDVVNAARRAHIVTIEDPIEFLHANKKSVIEQRELGEDTLSFASAVKHALRQAPDIILVGEMRDIDTMAAALTAAETGHLVISTLHTNDSPGAIDRIIDSFPPHQQNQVRSQLSMALVAVVAQRLVPTVDGKSQVAAVEILVNNAASANMIREGKVHHLYTVMETHGKDGMVGMDHALKALYLKGAISHEEAKRRMRSPTLLNS